MLIFQCEWRHSYWQLCTSIRLIGDNFTQIGLPLRGRPIFLITRLTPLGPITIINQIAGTGKGSHKPGKHLNVKNEGSRLAFCWKGEVSQ